MPFGHFSPRNCLWRNYLVAPVIELLVFERRGKSCQSQNPIAANGSVSDSGLELEAQRKTVADYLNGGKWTLAAEFVEIESGKRSDNRPRLAAALAACKKQRAKLVVAKLDRLSRNMAFIATMMDSSVEFVAVDNPHATRLTLHILAAVAEHERMMISQRTKAALAAAKANGRKLGGPKLAIGTKLGNKANAPPPIVSPPTSCRSSGRSKRPAPRPCGLWPRR